MISLIQIYWLLSFLKLKYTQNNYLKFLFRINGVLGFWGDRKSVV